MITFKNNVSDRIGNITYDIMSTGMRKVGTKKMGELIKAKVVS